MLPRERAQQVVEDFRRLLVSGLKVDMVDLIADAIDEYTVAQEEAPTCEEHPKYGGKRRPRSSCETCWKYYLWRKNG